METQEERRAVPGQLPLVGAVLNSHSNNKGHMGECRQRGLERYPALPFFTPSRSLNEALSALMSFVYKPESPGLCSPVHISPPIFHIFHMISCTPEGEKKTKTPHREMWIRIINHIPALLTTFHTGEKKESWLICSLNPIKSLNPKCVFCLQNLKSRFLLRGGGKKEKRNLGLIITDGSTKPVTRSDVINFKL